jgi:hypothetical protein
MSESTIDTENERKLWLKNTRTSVVRQLQNVREQVKSVSALVAEQLSILTMQLNAVERNVCTQLQVLQDIDSVSSPVVPVPLHHRQSKSSISTPTGSGPGGSGPGGPGAMTGTITTTRVSSKPASPSPISSSPSTSEVEASIEERSSTTSTPKTTPKTKTTKRKTPKLKAKSSSVQLSDEQNAKRYKLMQQGNQMVSTGNLDGAIGLYSKIIEQKADGPDGPSLFYNRGLAYSKQRRWADALCDFEQTTKLNAEYHAGRIALATALLKLSRFESALEQFTIARDNLVKQLVAKKLDEHSHPQVRLIQKRIAMCRNGIDKGKSEERKSPSRSVNPTATAAATTTTTAAATAAVPTPARPLHDTLAAVGDTDPVVVSSASASASASTESAIQQAHKRKASHSVDLNNGRSTANLTDGHTISVRPRKRRSFPALQQQSLLQQSLDADELSDCDGSDLIASEVKNDPKQSNPLDALSMEEDGDNGADHDGRDFEGKVRGGAGGNHDHAVQQPYLRSVESSPLTESSVSPPRRPGVPMPVESIGGVTDKNGAITSRIRSSPIASSYIALSHDDEHQEDDYVYSSTPSPVGRILDPQTHNVANSAHKPSITSEATPPPRIGNAAPSPPPPLPPPPQLGPPSGIKHAADAVGVDSKQTWSPVSTHDPAVPSLSAAAAAGAVAVAAADPMVSASSHLREEQDIIDEQSTHTAAEARVPAVVDPKELQSLAKQLCEQFDYLALQQRLRAAGLDTTGSIGSISIRCATAMLEGVMMTACPNCRVGLMQRISDEDLQCKACCHTYAVSQH